MTGASLPPHPPMPALSTPAPSMQFLAARRRRRRWIASAVLITVGGGLIGLYCAAGKVLGQGVSDELLATARAQVAARTGETGDQELIAGFAWDDCAILDLTSAHVAMIKENGVWRIGRSDLEPDVGFDTDDMFGSHSACLELARSTGPISNGAPDDGTDLPS